MEDNLIGVGLHLGSGKIKWDKWLNIDYNKAADVCCDIKKLDFLANNTADIAVSIHVIEHFYEWEVVPLLKEWYRVLKPGGKIVLELPCMEKVLNHIYLCMQNKLPISPSMGWFVFWGDPKYNDPHMGHKWGYTKPMIQAKLEEAGFKDVKFESPRYHFEIRDMRVEAYK